jgi:hypothetical protein
MRSGAGGVEGAAEAHVHLDLDPRNLQATSPDEGGHVAKTDRSHLPALDARPGLEAAGGDVDDDARLALLLRDDPLVERPRDERDRAVAAGGRVAGIVEEDDAEVGVLVVRLDDVAAVHVRVPARLEDEQPTDVVEPLERVTPFLQDRAAAERLHSSRDDPERLPAGVVVDGADHGRHATAEARRR